MTEVQTKPGHTITFVVPWRTSTVTVNRLIMDTVNGVLLDHAVRFTHTGIEADKRHEPRKGTTLARYVHGFGTGLRSSHVADFVPADGLVTVHFPPNYHGDSHETTDDWLRARVAVWHALIFALGMTPPGGAGYRTESVT